MLLDAAIILLTEALLGSPCRTACRVPHDAHSVDRDELFYVLPPPLPPEALRIVGTLVVESQAEAPPRGLHGTWDHSPGGLETRSHGEATVTFDQLLRRVEQRAADYEQSHEPGAVLVEGVQAEVDELWHSAQPANPEQPRRIEQLRLDAARRALGRLHVYRGTAIGVDRCYPDYARAIIYLAPIADSPDAIPEGFHVFLGPRAEPDHQGGMAMELLNESTSSTNRQLLDAAVILLDAALAATPRPHERRVARLCNLGTVYRVLGTRFGEPTGIDRAIDAFAQAVAEADQHDPNLPVICLSLGIAYRERYASTALLDDLTRGVASLDDAIARMGRDHPDRSIALFEGGTAHLLRYRRAGLTVNLTRAINLLAEAETESSARSSADLPVVLTNLGSAHVEHFLRFGAPDDLDQGVAHSRRAVELTPQQHSDRSDRLTNLCIALRRRYEHLDTLDDLNEAIHVGEQAVAAAAADHPNMALYLSNLGVAHRERHELIGSETDLRRAVESGEQATGLAGDNHPYQGLCLHNLALAYQCVFNRTGLHTDLELAIHASERAVAATPQDDVLLPARLHRLSDLRINCFMLVGDLRDLTRATDAAEQAVAATPKDDPFAVSAAPDARTGKPTARRELIIGRMSDNWPEAEIGEIPCSYSCSGGCLPRRCLSCLPWSRRRNSPRSCSGWVVY